MKIDESQATTGSARNEKSDSNATQASTPNACELSPELLSLLRVPSTRPYVYPVTLPHLFAFLFLFCPSILRSFPPPSSPPSRRCRFVPLASSSREPSLPLSNKWCSFSPEASTHLSSCDSDWSNRWNWPVDQDSRLSWSLSWELQGRVCLLFYHCLSLCISLGLP